MIHLLINLPSGLVTVSGSSVSTLDDFSYLQSALSSVTGLTGVNSASYTPSNSAAACPTIGSDWEAATALPPTPDTGLCDCMYDALACIPASSVTGDSDKISDLFSVVCCLSEKACLGILANGTSGEYGAYSMCSAEQQLGWALNAYYEIQSSAGNGASACSFSGSATTHKATSPTGSCATLISEAGELGTGTVTAAAGAASATGSGSSASGSSAGSGSSSSSGSAGIPAFANPLAGLANLQIGVYSVIAIGSAFGMIML